MEAGTGLAGILYHHHITAEMRFGFPDSFFKIGIIIIQFVHPEDHGCFKLLRVLPYNICTDFHAHHGINKHYTGISHTECRDHFTGEIIIAGGINNIDFISSPFCMKELAENRITTFLFKFVVISGSIPLRDRTLPGYEACFKQHALR